MDVGEDRISALPDSVILHILTFLHTREAVGTSILSKRWLWVWTSLPQLTFWYASSHNDEDPDPEEARQFMNYVDRVLLHHRMSNICKFTLACDEACDDFRVNSWISTIARHKLQELVLYVSIKQPEVIPQNIFSCESLTKMSIYKAGKIMQPASFSLPNLKTLCLRSMVFTDECLTKKFFSSFPIIEELTLEYCRWVNQKILLISVTSLKCISLTSCSFGEYPDLYDGAIKICAPNLERLVLHTRRQPKDVSLCDLSSLVYAEYYNADCKPLVTEEERCDSACNLLKGVFNAKVLKISADVVNVLPNQHMEKHLPILHNLVEFTILSRFCSGFDILCLLQLMPNLESLFFDRIHPYDKAELIFDKPPPCLLSSLKKVEVGEYDGHMGESCLIEFLLKNALALERMVITYGIDMTEHPRRMMKDRQRILMLTRGSMSCVIEFFDYPAITEDERGEYSDIDDIEEPAEPRVDPPADV